MDISAVGSVKKFLRGYFGDQLLYGDPNYDYYKLYYSLVGNYDSFNQKKFSLKITNHHIDLQISRTPWNNLDSLFFEETKLDKGITEFAHGLIWISLSGYTIDNLDSIYGAFFKGLESLSHGFKF